MVGRIGERPWTSIPMPTRKAGQRRLINNYTLDGGGKISVSLSRSIQPLKETSQVIGHDDEMQEMLKALGYVTGNEPTDN